MKKEALRRLDVMWKIICAGIAILMFASIWASYYPAVSERQLFLYGVSLLVFFGPIAFFRDIKQKYSIIEAISAVWAGICASWIISIYSEYRNIEDFIESGIKTMPDELLLMALIVVVPIALLYLLSWVYRGFRYED